MSSIAVPSSSSLPAAAVNSASQEPARCSCRAWAAWTQPTTREQKRRGGWDGDDANGFKDINKEKSQILKMIRELQAEKKCRKQELDHISCERSRLKGRLEDIVNC